MQTLKGWITLAVILVLLSPILNAADAAVVSAQPEQVQKQAQESCDSLIKADYPTFLKYTYPKVVQAMGGPEKMVAVLKTETEKMHADGFAIVSAQTGKPGEIQPTPQQSFCIVPTTIRLQTPKGV